MNERNRELALQVDLMQYPSDGINIRIERFAELVRADEREACAKVCDDIMQFYKTNTALNTDQNLIGYMAAELCGVRIRGKQ